MSEDGNPKRIRNYLTSTGRKMENSSGMKSFYLLVLVAEEELPTKKLSSILTTKSGRSSGL
ncbi:MAG: hypothetical protein WA364_00225, partial [Candidatus Nitrosopolaris sp.]